MVISALVFSTAGLFTKGVEAGAWDIIFWRGFFAAFLTSIYVTWRGTFRANYFEMGKTGWIAAIVGASGTAAFIPAFKLTSIANVALIYAATPMLAALIAWLCIGERLSRIVAIGCATAFLGVFVIVSGSIGGLNIRGDLLALWMTVAIAVLMVIYRRFPNTPGAGPLAVSSLLLLPLGLVFGTPFQNQVSEIAIMAAFGLVFALASVTLVEGAKRLPAGETALLSTLESPIAPVFAWLIFSEIPAITTVIGGLLILAGVVGSQLPNLKNRKMIEI